MCLCVVCLARVACVFVEVTSLHIDTHDRYWCNSLISSIIYIGGATPQSIINSPNKYHYIPPVIIKEQNNMNRSVTLFYLSVCN